MEPDAPVQTEQPAAPTNGNGQGEGGGDSLYDLSAAPEHLRPHLEAELKKIEGRVTPRFQEAAEYKQQWEPYEGIEGLTDTPPEMLSNLLQFGELFATDEQGQLAHPEEASAWWSQVGEQMGWLDDNSSEGEPGGDTAVDPQEELVDRVAQMLDERLGPIEQNLSAQDEQARQAAANDRINEDFAKLAGEHGEISDETRQDVLRLAYAHIDPEAGLGDDAISKGWEDYQRIAGKGASDLITPKLEGGAPVANGGVPATEAEEFHGFDDPDLKAAMGARFAA